MVSCPECGSQKVWKAGFRYIQGKTIQRYLCRECSFRFSDPEFSRKNEISGFSQTGSRQICALETERVKNLVAVEKTEKKTAGENNIKGEIVSFAWHLKKMGRSEATIRTYTKYLKMLHKVGATLSDPESTKMVIATHYKDQNTKRLATCAYDAFLKYLNVPWEKPHYPQEHKRVFIPTEQELQTAINTGRKQSIVFSQFLYETGARYNEAQRAEWTDLDRERNKASIKASKHGNARIVTVSRRLIDLLFSLPKTEKTVFPKRSPNARQVAFRLRMQNLARIHNNPRFLKIHCHTFRHCKALREYDKTKSILHVKKVLGHKSIMTTQRYVELYEEIYGDLKPENYVCETASTVKEAKKLVEAGFEYICEIECEQLFRKYR